MAKSGILFGVGINDAGYFVQPRGDKSLRCKFYQTWSNMLQRCYSKVRHEINSSYIGCHVDPEWLRFSEFKKWMSSQNWQGNHLDKDILFPGNKLYSPDTCVFVSQEVNKLLCDAASIRGEWPIGVCWAKREGKFLSRCCNPKSGKHEFLGYFDCPEEAHEAWRKRKNSLAVAYAEIQSDPRVSAALASRFSSKALQMEK